MYFFRLPLNLQPPSFLGKFFADETGDAPRPPKGGGRRRSQDIPPASTQDDLDDVDNGDFDDFDPYTDYFPDDIPSADDTSSIHLNLSDTFGDTSHGDPMDVDDDPQNQQQQQQDDMNDMNDIHRRTDDPGPHLRCPRFCNPGMTKCW